MQVRLLAYLKSPEMESIVRQLFATSLISTKDASTTSAVKAEFLSSLSLHLDVSESRLQPFAESFFSILVSGIERTLQTAIEKNVLPAHEAKSASRHRMLLDELANLRKNLAFLASAAKPDVNSILEFEAKYREVTGYIHGFIKPPHLESGRRVPIDEIFVAPSISYVPRQKGEKTETLKLTDLYARLYRGVLLGNPGGGKSTLSSKICYDLATRYSDRLFAGREATPLLVLLREYGSQKKATNCSIIQFLEQQAASRYQLRAPMHAFDYLLLSGRVFVIFDGLDELLDSSYRQEVTTNVEAFCKLYPAVPVLVTSREVGYEQAPLNDKTFSLFRLAPFDEEQVKEYATKWFARDEDYSPDQKVQKASAFYADSAFVPDLRSNPLMLGLMCNLYRAEGYIPRNRPEVYGKCSIMLFERWDKSRDIVVPLPFEEHIRPAMQDLAFWIYSNDELQGGVSESRLIERTADYLCKWVFDDTFKATMAASDFIRFCTGRAWVFTDTGTTREGERLFQFTHRTFLEYFTASYLVSIHPTPGLLMEALTMRISKGEWDVVAQLSFQIQAKQVHDAADELLGQILGVKTSNASERWNLLSFAERSLEFLVPTPKVRRDITKAALEFWLQLAQKEPLERYSGQGREITEHIGNLFLVTVENRDTVADEVETFLVKGVLSDVAKVSSLATELVVDLTHPLHVLENRRQVSEEVRRFWDDLSERIISQTRDRVLEVAHSDAVVALRCHWKRLIPISAVVEDFGIQVLFDSIRSPALGNVWFYPPGHLLIDSVFGQWRHHDKEGRERDARELASVSEILLRTATPWVTSEGRDEPQNRGWFSAGWAVTEEERADPIPISANANFATLCILGIEVEFARSPGQVAAVLERNQFIPPLVRQVLLGRVSEKRREDAVEGVSKFGFETGQAELLRKWVVHEVNFVRSRSGSASPSHQRKRTRRHAK
jgi:hypothetical protein